MNLRNKAIYLYKEYKELLFLLTISILIIFNAYIFRGYQFRIGYSNDHLFQIPQFYTEYARLIKESIETKSPIFYSWNTFLGNSFYASKVYYVTGDILFILAVIFIKNLNIYNFLLFETIACLYIAAFSFYNYLSSINVENKWNKIIFSLVYSLSGGALSFIQYPMFLRFYAILPLLFFGVENYLKKNKLFFFSIIVCLLWLQNYYFMIPTTMFLPLFFIYRSYLREKDDFNILKCLLNSIPLIISYLIGFMLSMVVILPGIMFIIGNNRLSYNELNGMLTWPIKTWISLFYNSLIPNADMSPFYLNLGTENPAVSSYYSISITAIGYLAIGSLFINITKEKIASISIIAILIACNMFLPINSMIHMFTTPTMRFSFILLFMLLSISSFNLEISAKEQLLKITKVEAILIFLLTIICLITNIINLSDKLLPQVILSLAVLIIIALFFDKKKFIIFITLLEIVLYGVSYVSGYPFEKYCDELSEESFEYFINNNEDKLFRIYLNNNYVRPYGSELNLNSSLFYNYMGLSSYDTTYDYSIDEFIKYSNGKVANNIFDINNPSAFKLLGVKYVIVENSNQLDNYNSYTFVDKIKHLEVYEIDDYNHLGHTFTKFKDSLNDIYDLDDELSICANLKNNIIDIIPADKTQFIITNQLSSNNFQGYIDLNSKQVLMVAIPYDEGWRITDNGSPIATYNVDGGFIGLVLNEGHHELDAWYQPKGFKIGFILSSVGAILLLFELIFEKKLNQ